MNKLSLVMVNAVALGLIGCGSGSSTEGSTEGSTAVADSIPSEIAEIDTTTESQTNGTDGAADGTAGGTEGSSADGGTQSQGNNPGMVPDPILGEVSSIDLSAFAGPAGFKIYSGDEIDPALSIDFAEFVENRYINLEFPCSGETGNIEVYPRGFLGIEAEEPYGGTFSWEIADPQDEFGTVDLEIASVAFGEPTNVGLPFTIDNVVNGSLIVGSGLLEDLVVTRIVQFDACN